jgi:hypothetical protein
MAAVALIVGVEFVQVLVVSRPVQFVDVAFGWLGILIGGVIVALLTRHGRIRFHPIAAQ